jgi:O-antigen/teichoic acid export membrane protein
LESHILILISTFNRVRELTKKKLVQDTFWFTLSNIFFQGCKFLTYLYAAKFLGPKTYGLWNGLLLILTYGMNSHLGVLNAMNREIPFYEGVGNYNKIEEIRNVGAGVVLYSAIPIALVVFLTSFLPFIDSETALGLQFVAVILVMQQINTFYQMILRSHGLFNLLSLQQFYLGFLSLVVVINLTKFYGFEGFLLAQAVSICVMITFTAIKVPLKIRPMFNFDKVISLVKIGFPIMSVGLAYGMLTTIDRMMILKYLGKEQLGYYSLSIMATSILALFPMTVAQVTYPAMAKKYGECQDKLALRDLIFRPTRTVALVMFFLLTIVYFLFPPLVEMFLPEYIKGIPALRITIFGVFFLSLVGGFANFMNTVGMQKLYMCVQVVAIIMVVGFNSMFIWMGYGVIGVAVSTSITYIIYACLMTFIVMYTLNKENGHLPIA